MPAQGRSALRLPRVPRGPAAFCLGSELMIQATLAIQVLPLDTIHAVDAIDAAIVVILGSGVEHEIGAMETTLEGDSLSELLEIAHRAHRAALETAGGPVQTNIRMIESPHGILTMREKTTPFRRESAA